MGTAGVRRTDAEAAIQPPGIKQKDIVMRTAYSIWASILLAIVLSAGVSAQRGGGGRGGSSEVAGAPPTLLTAYDNADYGIRFPAPPDFSIFTPDQPGRFRQIFTERRIAYLVDLVGADAAVTVRYLPAANEADLQGFKSTLESKPPQATLPGYKKISVGSIKIGAAHDKDAVDYVYTSKDKDLTTTTRQVVFVHKGKGFTFTCVAPEKDYASVDRKSFEKLFASIEFR
jgi:hypothetical protein